MKAGELAFVTGATGFIGTKLIEKLVDRGIRVRGLSRRENPQPPPCLSGEGGNIFAHELVELVRGDVTDRESVFHGMEGCDYCFHLAAYAKNWAPSREVFYKTNIEGTRSVFDAVKAFGVRRVVWTSTCLTTGPTPPGAIGDETMIHNDEFFTLYEETKTLMEREAVAMAAEGFPVVIVNPTRVFGPGQLTEANSCIRLIDEYDRGLAPFLLNRGVNVGNWVLVDDVAEGHILAMERGRIGQRYLLGGDNASLKELLEMVDKVSGRRHLQIPLLTYAPMVFAWLQRKRAEWFGIYPTITPGWIKTFATDWAYRCDKAKAELGYRFTPLSDGIQSTYQWIQRVRRQVA